MRVLAFNIFIILMTAWGGSNLDCTDDKVLANVKQLGSNVYKEREEASKALEAMGEKMPVQFLEAIANKKFGKKYDREQEIRCKRLVRPAFNIFSDSEELPYPGIWFLTAEIRFPLSYIDKSRDWEHGHWKYVSWMVDKHQEYWAPIDLSAVYYQKAKKMHIGTIDPDKRWRNEEIEKEATILLVKDLRRGGMPTREIERLLNRMLYWKTALYFRTPTGYYDKKTGQWVQIPEDKPGIPQ